MTAMWFGPDVGPGSVCVGPVRIEKWRKQPLRSLLFGASKGDEKIEVCPGLLAAIGVSKGMPQAQSDVSMFCAGVRLTDVSGSRNWRCFCDVRVTLLGDRRELSRTVRWVLTPDASEMFFPLMQLSDADRFVTSSGALRVKADLLFHFYVLKDPCPGYFESGAQDTTLRALMYAWCLAGPSCMATASATTCGAVSVCRDPKMQRPCKQRRTELDPWLRPGLLTHSTARSWEVAGKMKLQELIPGLLIGAGEAPAGWPMAQFPKLGIGRILELQLLDRPEGPEGLEGPEGEAEAEPTEEVEGIEAVEPRENGEVQVVLMEWKDGEWLQGASSGAPTLDALVATAHEWWAAAGHAPAMALLLPKTLREVPCCTQLAVQLVARSFQMSLADSRRYVGYHWPHCASSWPDDVAELPRPSAEAASKALLEACEAHENGENQREVATRFATWFATSCSAPGPSLAAVRAWHRPAVPAIPAAAAVPVPWYGWQPGIPGQLLLVHESGWGAVPEIFKSYLCAREEAPKEVEPLGSLVTLQFANILPQDEVLAVPHSFELADVQWHLVALICLEHPLDPNSCSSVTCGLQSMPPLRRVAFLHGQNSKEWLVEEGALLELRRRKLPTTGPPPNSWCCVRDLSPELVIYMRGAPQGRQLPAAVRADGIPGAPGDAKVLQVRIVTEKALQKTRGNFEGGSAVSASAVLKLTATSTLEDLKQRIHQSLRIPPERQLLLQLPDVSPSGFTSWLVPVRSPLASLLPHAQLRGTEMIPTVLLMFLSNDADLESLPSMLQWPMEPVETEAGVPRQLPPMMPLLCKYFNAETMTYCVLGVLMVAPEHTLLQHLVWLRKRIAVGGFEVKGALACSASLGPGQDAAISSSRWFQMLRMDVPLIQQPLVGFGSCINFEEAVYGRQQPSASPVPPVEPSEKLLGLRTFGCLTLDSQLRGHRAAWNQLKKVVVGEFLDAKMCKYQDGSIVVFQLSDGFGEEDARHLCAKFAAEPSAETAICKGKLARYQPLEFYILQAPTLDPTTSNQLAMCTVWWAQAPNLHSISLEAPAIPLDFLAALDHWSLPRCAEMQLVHFGAEGVPLSTAWRPGLANEVCWLEPVVEKAIETMEVEEVAERVEGEVENSVWLRARRKRWADETDTSEEESEEKVDAAFNVQLQSPGGSPQRSSASDAPSLRGGAAASPAAAPLAAPGAQLERTESPQLRLEFLVEDARSSSGDAGDKKDVQQSQKEERQQEPSVPRGRTMVLARSDEGRAAECPQLRRQGICFEGLSCSHLHPAGSQLVRPEACPFNSELRDRCPLRNLCAFSHGSAEQRRPPIFRAKAEAAHSASSEAPEPLGRCVAPFAASDAAANVVRRSLRSATGEVVALLAEARALGLMEEVCAAERRLLNALAATPSAGPGPPPRSRAMSRASSYDSFFDGDVAKFVLASTPGDTQPSTPRSSLTPTGWPNDRYARYALPDWLAEEQTMNIHNQLNLDVFPGTADSQFGVFEEKQRDDLQMPATWHDAPLGAPVPSMPSTLVLHRAVPRKRSANRSPEEVAVWADEAQELRPVASTASASSISRHKWQQNAIPPGIGLMWHSSPFGISRTPNIHTPASHRSPARSPTSFSGYCSPIPGFSSGVASPNQRRSGYSSPSTMSGTAFFAGAATQSGLMRRLMSLREARGEEQEEESDDRSSEERSEDEGEPPDLLELLLKHAEKVAPSCREPRLLSLDLRPTVPVSQRGLLPCHSVPFLNALVQTLLASSLMPLLAQVSPRQQRPAYSCFMQLALELSGASRWADAGLLLEPLLRRFERGKAVQEAPAFPGPWKVPGLSDMFSCFLHFLLGQLHDECKWPSTLSISSSQHEDSPLMRIFGGLIRLNSRTSKAPRRVDRAPETSAFLLLHLDLTESGGSSSVELELQQLLLRYDARFLRLPPFLLLHLERFRTGADGLPDRVSKKCRMDLRLELEEASSYTLRSVPYQLRGAMCHYGEVPEGGAYKALITEAAGPGGGGLRWHVLDDVTVRCKSQEEMQEMLEAEGHHVCFLMYHRLDTKTVNLRPHAALS